MAQKTRTKRVPPKPLMSGQKGSGPGPLGTPPSPLPPFLSQVISLFVEAIHEDVHGQCTLADGTPCPSAADKNAQEKHLSEFVKERLDIISQIEYRMWLNGRMPFVSPRDLQLWRLRQFAKYIWGWNLPDDDDVGKLFNLTKRQASGLVADFHAKFHKVYLYPLFLLRILDLISGPGMQDEVQYRNALGNVYRIPSKRFVYETNTVIGELRAKFRDKILRDATLYRGSEQYMWVDTAVVYLLRIPAVREWLKKLHPPPGGDDE